MFDGGEGWVSDGCCQRGGHWCAGTQACSGYTVTGTNEHILRKLLGSKLGLCCTRCMTSYNW